MNKEALLNIILSDINEVETLLKSFQGSEEIPAAFIDLTERKMTHILDEFTLLKTLTQTPQAPTPHKIIEEQKTETIIVDTKEKSEPKNDTPVIKEEVVVEKEEKEQPQNTEPNPVISETIPAPKVEQTTQEIPNEEEKPLVEKVEIKEAISTTTRTEITETPAPEPKKEEVKEDIGKTLGESLVGEKKSVNDLIANNKESKRQQTLMGKPIADLTKSLGLNDRFMFQRELFEGNADVMKQTLLQLNEMPDFNSAQSFISSNFNWDNEQEATQAFYSYIKRKYY